MKITPKQYAQSLYESLVGKTKEEVKDSVARLVKILADRRELNKAVEIISSFQEIWDREQGELSADLVTAREASAVSKTAVIDYLKDKTGAEKIHLSEKIDPAIIGGFILKYRSKIVDASLRSSLQELKEEMVG